MSQLPYTNFPHLHMQKMPPSFASPNDFIDIVFTVPVNSKVAPRKVLPPTVVRDIKPHSHGRCEFCSHGVLDVDGVCSEDGDRRDNRFKTELCRNFEISKRCPYGKKCLFAHGQDELRPLIRNPLFKTSPCYWFHKVGICNHGKRCVFAHHHPYFDETDPTPSEEQMSREHRLPIFSALTTIGKIEDRVRLSTV